ncbi:DUF742 domain-containing protein [Nocardia aobensis]|uniref:DUF742 domain-containing protein n=1 Tax=Nocardia aobensis TaxID=257277 RepID=A0ABW6P9R1_9NOCA
MIERDPWFDDEAGPLVRPFAITRGRARSDHHDLDLITLVMTRYARASPQTTEPEYAEILRLCHAPQSVAEVSAHIGLPVASTKVLISDLIDLGYLTIRSQWPTAASTLDDLALLRMVLDGIRSL